MTQDIDQSSKQASKSHPQSLKSHFRVSRRHFALAILVVILSIVFASRGSSSLRTSFKNLSSLSISRTLQGVRQNSPSFLTDQHNSAGTDSMASLTKAKAEDCAASGKVQAKLTPAEEKRWNHLAEGMNAYHNHFRYEFDRVYTLADGGFHKEGMSLARFLREAQGLSQHLTMHHSIEAYIFPVLAKKMPQFKAGARESGEHLKSHKGIHDGLERYDKFLKDALADTSSYNASVLRGIMDGFREVLFRHLDEEVRDLGGESLRAAGWTLQELRQIPM